MNLSSIYRCLKISNKHILPLYQINRQIWHFRNILSIADKISANDKDLTKCTYATTHEISTIEKPDGKEYSLIKKILSKFPFISIDKGRLNAAGYLLYESIADKIKYVDFFEEFNLPDTFYSWFVITELHVWMLMVRCMAEGDDGRYVRNRIVQALWSDVGLRVKKLGASNPAGTRAQVQELNEQFQAALIAYDEGLQSDDVVLAGAIWRRMYQQGEVDPENLDLLIKYIRKHVSKSFSFISERCTAL
ncbi:ubiquinol-cytochrome c reductase complex assembly factor 1 family member [Holotrichia oblita]|uniref:Ubiquinol-cytochrome c reductase complex assembly factor 1 family member n=2 Tax=Holotrichia oblita TaxID=644536 RepID=A0ACB9SYR1_HOLOL|nr:ubiquinol-cytochrome c reductase complex assembly factor 1 family member [Holotrichia oblita]